MRNLTSAFHNGKLRLGLFSNIYGIWYPIKNEGIRKVTEVWQLQYTIKWHSSIVLQQCHCAGHYFHPHWTIPCKVCLKILASDLLITHVDEMKEWQSMVLSCCLRDCVSHSGTGMETIFLLMAQEEFWLMPSFPEHTGRETFTLTTMSLGRWATVWVSENPWLK